MDEVMPVIKVTGRRDESGTEVTVGRVDELLAMEVTTGVSRGEDKEEG